MKYTSKQIENAKVKYNNYLKFETAENQSCFAMNPFEAERRAEYHNNLVSEILDGNKEIEKGWKLFFLNEEVRKDQKNEASKAKLLANKEASSDILSPIKSIKKLGAFGKWLNNSKNSYRKQHFNKNYTVQAVNAFLETL